MIIESALLCLALNVYHESRGEAIFVQQAIAQVTMTRARQDRNKVCKEVFRPYQFSWANKLSKESKKNPMRIYAKRIKNPNGFEWKRAIMVAKQALAGKLPKTYAGATHFYNYNVVNPKWSKHLTYVAHAGPFILMKEPLRS